MYLTIGDIFFYYICLQFQDIQVEQYLEEVAVEPYGTNHRT